MPFTKHQFDVQFLWNEDESCRITGIEVKGLDGPFDAWELLYMSTEWSPEGTGPLDALELWLPRMYDVRGQMIAQYGLTQPLL